VIRKLFSGVAPLGADAIGQCMRRIGCVLQQGYGLTETSPATHVTPADPARIKHGSIAIPKSPSGKILRRLLRDLALT
jgi:long-subunit acyl-CoA synthetase (AMP-forming)